MANFLPNKGKEGKFREDTWRLQSAAVLTGLVMLDFDHLDFPPEDFADRIPDHMYCDDCDNQVLYWGFTPSHKGVRAVCKADIKRGNLADNQAYLSRIFGLECDESVKNADRCSFAVPIEEIRYIDDQLFTYQNDEYDKMFGDQYRRGKAPKPTPSPSRAGGETKIPEGEKIGEETKNPEGEKTGGEASNLPSRTGGVGGGFIDRWIAQNGVPQPGSRHLTALRLAADLRYLCDNDAAKIKQVMLLAPFVQEIIAERGEREIDDICTDVVGRKMNLTMPKKLQTMMEDGKAQAQGAAEEQRLLEKYAVFWERLKPLMTEIYDLPTYRMEDYNKLGGVFIAGAMYCTLLTRCYYRHFDGEMQRMNPQVYMIGNPASGKGEAEKLDQIIMAPVITADKVGRQAEKEYKRQQKERSTSSKAQKGEALKRPEYVIRYLPSKTSNAVFYRRQLNAVEEIGGEKFPLHLYTFDSELDSNTTAQSGGSWIGKHDIELKAFHNEFTGVDFGNVDSVNDVMQIFYNSVCTGTPLSLNRKVTPRNVNDGLCSRMAIYKMVPAKYAMISKGNRLLMHEKRCKLQQWAFKFDKLGGEMPIRKLVDHVYKLCEDSAMQAELEHDDVLDYLRKRAVFYATWFTVPRIMERAVKEAEKPTPGPSRAGGETKTASKASKRPSRTGGDGGGCDPVKLMKVEKSDLDFASLIYEAVIYWQDYFFGRMLQDSWDNAERDMKPRSRQTYNGKTYNQLPSTFTLNDLEEMAQISHDAAKKQVQRWKENGYIKSAARGSYEKMAKVI